jgi:predicted TPR repeat methyltransferase
MSRVERTWNEVLAEAVQLHRADDLRGAEVRYQALLQLQPENPDVLHFLGVLRHGQERNEEAEDLVRRALAVAPGYVDAWNNLGNILLQLNRAGEAGEAYRRAVELNDTHAGAWNNLARILRTQKKYPEAIAAHQRAIELLPEADDAYFTYANTLHEFGDFDAALAAYRTSLKLNPRNARANTAVTYFLFLGGKREEAIALTHEWLQNDPGNPVAIHLLSAFTGEAVPDRASVDYIKVTYDNLAEWFDDWLLGTLHYRAPELVGAALASVLGEPRGELEILDAGCGTGLCAQHVRGHARNLEGVDLSERMLRKAHAKGSYDRLYEGELTNFMDVNPGAWNAILSADTLCYIGDLEPVARAAFKALRPDGWFVFTTERRDGEGFAMGPSGRYAHSREYIQRVLRESGFEDIALDEEILRTEAGSAVSGYVVRAHVIGTAEEAV